ncbi:MAG: 50S ribosomal protein L21 [Dehalococcoidia bacterium]
MYAVVRTGGKQYRVEAGRAVTIDRLPGEAGDSIELRDVLLMADGDAVTVGAPVIDGARVMGTIAEQGRAPKIVVFRYKAKTRSRKKTGHRQPFTKVLVDEILAPGQEPSPKAPPPAAEAPDVPAAPPKGRRGRRGAAAIAETPAEATSPDVEAEAAAQDAAPEAAPEGAAQPEAASKPRRGRKKTESAE